MDVDQLEIEYTPSLFSKRFPVREDLFAHFNKFSVEESEKARFQFNCHLNVSYGESSEQKLDIFGDDLPANSPIFIFIHGGYWQAGCTKWDSAYFVKPLVEQGIRVFSVEYDLCPTVTLDVVVSQMQKAFMWISDYISKNSIKSVSFLGHSAGAHLQATSLTNNFMDTIASDVKIFNYFISGVFDLTELWKLKAANENNILSLDESNCHRLSPQFLDFSFLNNHNVQNFVFVGEFESKKFIKQSRDFAEVALKEVDNVNFEITKGRDHFDIVEKLNENDYEITKLIVKNARNA